MKKITVLGTGCPKCKTLFANAEKAAQDANIEYEMEKIEDIAAIVSHGVMSTPALAVDGKVVSSGKMLSPSEIKAHIE